MTRKNSAHYQREYRRRLRDQGLIKKEIWIRPENSRYLAQLEQQLRERMTSNDELGDLATMKASTVWSTDSLFSALLSTALVKANPRIDYIEGLEPVIYLELAEYGDMPLFITVSGEQVLVECQLWPISAVKDLHTFNLTVLKTHKFFPLSTISIESTSDGEDAYFMFGALSHASTLNSILIEIETLASNVLQATLAYDEYLVSEDVA